MIKLTERQEQVCDLLAQGLSDNEIAEKLGLALPTIKGYIQCSKYVFQAKNRVSLALSYLRYKGKLK